MKAKRIIALLLSLVFVFTMLGACGSTSDDTADTATDAAEDTADSSSDGVDYGEYSADNPLEITLSHFVASETNQIHLLAAAFKEKVEEATGGAVIVNIVMGGQLGNDEESLQSVMAGTLDMAVNNTPIMSTYYEKFQILDLPYLFEDYDQIYAFLESDICQTLMDEFAEATGARMLCMQCVGFRNLESSKGIVTSVDDISGLKTRCTSSNVYISTWEAWGANVQTIASSEMNSAISQGVIDACDNVNNVAYSNAYYEYCPYISIMEYAAHFNGLTISEELYQSLTEDLQEAISTAALEAAAERTAALEAEDDEYIENMVNNDVGVEVTVYYLTDDEKAALREAAQSVYDDFIETYDAQDDVDAILALAD